MLDYSSALWTPLCAYACILKAIWVLILELLELNFGVRTGEFDVFLSTSGPLQDFRFLVRTHITSTELSG